MKSNINLLCCPNCQEVIADSLIYSYTGKRAGSVTSAKKARTARRNGKLGGRPKKKPPDLPKTQQVQTRKGQP